jgi:hypothetical protein
MDEEQTQDDINELIELLTGAAAVGILALFQQLESGDISPVEYQRAVEILLAEHHTAAYMAGANTDDLTDTDLVTIEEVVQDQYGYLDRFTEVLLAGAAVDELARWRSRALMYAQPVGASVWRGATRSMPRLPAYPKDGSTDCLVHCCCEWVIIDVDIQAGDWDCYWKLGGCNHCKHCPRRRRDWYPLRIRGGEFTQPALLTQSDLFR